MSLELPLVSAVIARQANPTVHLAAYGGLVFPLSMMIEAPIIMLLSASTALSRDLRSYRLMWRAMMAAGAGLTALHVLLAFTPLFDLVIVKWIHAPVEVVEPVRLGLRLMTPWTWSIAYRRFQQGVLIRAGRSSVIGQGTLVRLSALGLGLLLMRSVFDQSGVVTAATAVAMGVVAEAAFIGFRVRPAIRDHLALQPVVAPALTLGGFLHFYVPLALTAVLHLLTQPIGSAALSRMPGALSSLAVWPVVASFTFVFRGVAIAFNEVVVAHSGRPGAEATLRRFTQRAAAATGGVLALVAVTPLAHAYFAGVSGLAPSLVPLAEIALWCAIPLPFVSFWQSRYQGILVRERETRAVLQSVCLALATTIVVAFAGVAYGRIPGVFVMIVGFVLAMLAQVAWLRSRTHRLRRRVSAAVADARITNPLPLEIEEPTR